MKTQNIVKNTIRSINDEYTRCLLEQNRCISTISKNFFNWTPEEFENYLRNHAAYIEWFWICSHYILSESFIREMKEYIHWDSVFEFQIYHLSENFMLELIGNYDKFGIYIKGFNKKDTISYMNRRLFETREIK